MKKTYTKYLTCILLTVVLLLASTIPALATDYDSLPNESIIDRTEEQIEINDTKFKVVRQISADEGVTSITYRDPDAPQLSKEGVISLFEALGLTEEALGTISPKEIEHFATACELGVKTTYVHTNELTGKTEYLKEEDALKQVSENISNRAAIMASVLNSDVQPLGFGLQTEPLSNPYIDTYMRIQLYWDRQFGSDTYSFYTVASWLTMPSQRHTDAVGIIARACSLVPGTCSGYYSYTRTTTNAGQTQSQRVSSNITNHYTPVNGDWYGGAGKVYLPTDAYDVTSDLGVSYTNFLAYYQCEMKIMYPTLPANFNAAGAYTHTRIYIGPTASIAISAKTLGISLSGTILTYQDIRSAEALISYTP